MKRTGRLFFTLNLLLLFALLACQAVCAAEAGGVYTLEQGIKEALESNWSIKAREEKVSESEYAEKESRADFLPSFSTSYGVTRLNTAPSRGNLVMGDQTSYQWKATVAQPIFTGFAITSAHELARLGIDQSKTAVELARLNLALQVKEAYFNILKADKAVGVAKSAVDSLQAHLAVARNFYQVGMTPANDLLKAEVELANVQHNYIKAQNDLRLARVSFNVLLSRPMEDPLEIEDILVFSPESPDLDASLARALKTRPEMKALNLSDAQIDQQIRLSRSSYYPDATVAYNYIKAGDTPAVAGSDFLQSDSWQVSVGVSWTFWDFHKTRNAVSRGESQKKQLSLALKSQEDAIRLELKSAILRLKEAEEKIPTARKAVEQAEENLRVSEQRYQAQVTTSTEVLDAETLLSQARMNYYSSLYDHNLSRAALLRAMGEY